MEASACVIEPRLWVEEVARVVAMEKEVGQRRWRRQMEKAVAMETAVGHAVERAEEESGGIAAGGD